MTPPEDDLAAYLVRLESLAREARDGGDEHAEVLAELQRVSSWALRVAVARARERGVSWRELGKTLGLSPTTLHGQFSAGRGVVAAVGQSEPPKVARTPQPLPTGGMPSPLDRFVGREAELADLKRVLARNRLVTLCGPAGVGKTRLAIEHVHHLHRSYRGGMWWVSLAQVSADSLVPSAVAAAVGGHGVPPERLIVEKSRGAPALLVLDNCEHVVAGAADLAERVLAACPRVSVLATSRESLRVAGEARFAVSPLPLPDDLTAADCRHLDAVRLYVDRAREVLPSFALTDEVAGAVAEVCVRLDGLPLAIELAARQIRLLPPDVLLERGDSSLDLLVGGPRSAPRRHQSLRAAIEWGYELLGKDEQDVFRRLSVLPGGFNAVGASAVCADLGLSAESLWTVLTRLAEKSMLVIEERFRILDPLRAFGREQLEAAGELHATHDRLLTWLSLLVHDALFGMPGPDDLTTQVREERSNLQYAVVIAEAAEDERYPQLAAGLASCLRLAGDLREAQVVAQRALSVRDRPSAGVVLVLVELVLTLSLRGIYDRAKELSTSLLRMADEIDRPHLTAWALAAASMAHRDIGDEDVAIKLNLGLVAMLRRSGNGMALALALNLLAWDHLRQGDLDGAKELADEAIQLVESSGAMGERSAGLVHTAGAIALARGDHDEAAALFTLGLAMSSASWDHVAHHLEGLAVVAAQDGESERALRLSTSAARMRTDADLRADPWWEQQVREATAGAMDEEPLSIEEAIDYALHDRLPPSVAAPTATVLTPRESQIAELVAEGLTNQQIAARLEVSPRTVASHLERIRSKLDVPTRAQLTAWVLQQRG